MDNCIFCKIAAGEIPSAKVYEDDKMLVFKDIEPKAKVHLLCVPKEHFAFLSEADEKRAALIGRTRSARRSSGVCSGRWANTTRSGGSRRATASSSIRARTPGRR